MLKMDDGSLESSDGNKVHDESSCLADVSMNRLSKSYADLDDSLLGRTIPSVAPTSTPHCYRSKSQEQTMSKRKCESSDSKLLKRKKLINFDALDHSLSKDGSPVIVGSSDSERSNVDYEAWKTQLSVNWSSSENGRTKSDEVKIASSAPTTFDNLNFSDGADTTIISPSSDVDTKPSSLPLSKTQDTSDPASVKTDVASPQTKPVKESENELQKKIFEHRKGRQIKNEDILKGNPHFKRVTEKGVCVLSYVIDEQKSEIVSVQLNKFQRTSTISRSSLSSGELADISSSDSGSVGSTSGRTLPWNLASSTRALNNSFSSSTSGKNVDHQFLAPRSPAVHSWPAHNCVCRCFCPLVLGASSKNALSRIFNSSSPTDVSSESSNGVNVDAPQASKKTNTSTSSKKSIKKESPKITIEPEPIKKEPDPPSTSFGFTRRTLAYESTDGHLHVFALWPGDSWFYPATVENSTLDNWNNLNYLNVRYADADVRKSVANVNILPLQLVQPGLQVMYKTSADGDYEPFSVVSIKNSQKKKLKHHFNYPLVTIEADGETQTVCFSQLALMDVDLKEFKQEKGEFLFTPKKRLIGQMSHDVDYANLTEGKRSRTAAVFTPPPPPPPVQKKSAPSTDPAPKTEVKPVKPKAKSVLPAKTKSVSKDRKYSKTRPSRSVTPKMSATPKLVLRSSSTRKSSRSALKVVVPKKETVKPRKASLPPRRQQPSPTPRPQSPLPAPPPPLSYYPYLPPDWEGICLPPKFAPRPTTAPRGIITFYKKDEPRILPKKEHSHSSQLVKTISEIKSPDSPCVALKLSSDSEDQIKPPGLKPESPKSPKSSGLTLSSSSEESPVQEIKPTKTEVQKSPSKSPVRTPLKSSPQISIPCETPQPVVPMTPEKDATSPLPLFTTPQVSKSPSRKSESPTSKLLPSTESSPPQLQPQPQAQSPKSVTSSPTKPTIVVPATPVTTESKPEIRQSSRLKQAVKKETKVDPPLKPTPRKADAVSVSTEPVKSSRRIASLVKKESPVTKSIPGKSKIKYPKRSLDPGPSTHVPKRPRPLTRYDLKLDAPDDSDSDVVDEEYHLDPDKVGGGCLDFEYIPESTTSSKTFGDKKTKSSISTGNKSSDVQSNQLGPIPTKPIFEGYYFVLTHCDPVTKSLRMFVNSLPLNQNKTKISDESTSSENEPTDFEDYYTTNVEFDYYRLKTQIVAGGGILHRSLTEIPKEKYSSTIVITDYPCQTPNYLLAVLQNIPIFRHDLIIDCCKKGKHIKSMTANALRMSRGRSLDTSTWLEACRKSKTPFKLLKIVLPVVSEIEVTPQNNLGFWQYLLETAGATVGIYYKGDNLEDCLRNTHAIIGGMGQLPDELVEYAKSKQIPIVTPMWIQQSIVHGTAKPFDCHPEFSIDL